MKKFIAGLLILPLIFAGCSKTGNLPDEGKNNPPPTVNFNGKQYTVSGNVSSEPPENGELFVFVENWPFQNEKLQYVYSNGWIKCS